MWSSTASRYNPQGGATAFNAGAWLVWLIAAMLGTLLTRNPIYLGLAILAAILVNGSFNRAERHNGSQDSASMPTPQSDPAQRSRGLLLRAVLGLLVVVTIFKGLSLHLGVTVLFSLPGEWPLIGGPITAEGLVYAAQDALQLLAILAVFNAFSRGADYYALLRSVPAFFHQVGLITSIAITFVPQTVTRYAEIREAQALRGHRVRGIRDLVPIVIPLMSGGMERSMNLAEAMEARGFSRNPPGTHRVAPIAVQGGIAGGLALILVGGTFLAFFAQMPAVGWSGIVAGLVLISITLLSVSKRSKRTRYRRNIWRDTDTLLALPSLGIAAILLIYRFVAPGALIYDPLSTLRIYAPPFDPVLALVMLAIALPAFILRGGTIDEGRRKRKDTKSAKDRKDFDGKRHPT